MAPGLKAAAPAARFGATGLDPGVQPRGLLPLPFDGPVRRAWAAHAAGEGSKGLRLYDWARIALAWTVEEGFERWLLIRRSQRDWQDCAYYLVFAPAGTQLAELAGAAGLRWTIEECFQRKGGARARPLRGPLLARLAPAHDLCMAALPFLAGLSAQLRRAATSKLNERSPRAIAA